MFEWDKDAITNPHFYPPFDERDPVCPICGQIPEYAYYRNLKGHAKSLIGCDCCISRKSYDDTPEFYPEEGRRPFQ